LDKDQDGLSFVSAHVHNAGTRSKSHGRSESRGLRAKRMGPRADAHLDAPVKMATADQKRDGRRPGSPSLSIISVHTRSKSSGRSKSRGPRIQQARPRAYVQLDGSMSEATSDKDRHNEQAQSTDHTFNAHSRFTSRSRLKSRGLCVQLAGPRTYTRLGASTSKATSDKDSCRDSERPEPPGPSLVLEARLRADTCINVSKSKATLEKDCATLVHNAYSRSESCGRSTSRSKSCCSRIQLEGPRAEAHSNVSTNEAAAVKGGDGERAQATDHASMVESPQGSAPRPCPRSQAIAISGRPLRESPQCNGDPFARAPETARLPTLPTDREPISHRRYKLGDAARDEDMLVCPRRLQLSRGRQRQSCWRGRCGKNDVADDVDSSVTADSDSKEGARARSLPETDYATLAIGHLRLHDAAFVRRTDGNWTYALVVDSDPAHICFVVNHRGSTKSFPQPLWTSYVRRIRALSTRSGDKCSSNARPGKWPQSIGRSKSFRHGARIHGGGRRGSDRRRLISPSPTRKNLGVLSMPPTIVEH